MSRTTSPSTGRLYGLTRVARTWRVSRAIVYRRRARPPTPAPRRPGPLGACLDAELVAHIRQQILASRFHGEGYRKIWARLRFAGVRTTPRRARRLMGAHDLLAPHRVGRLRSRTHDGTIVTETVNVMWGTDMTETITVAEGGARVFIAVDHANSEVVGIHACKSGNRFEALEPVRQGVRRHFGSIGPGVAVGLKLRHDHGSRTLKENFLWGHTFDTVEDLRRAVVEFARHYNETWLVARHGYRTPAQVRADQLGVDEAPMPELPLAA